MMGYNSHTLVVQCMNDEWVKFRSCRRVASAPIVSEQAGAAMDVQFVIFCVNCFVNSIGMTRQKPACINVYIEKTLYILYIKCLYLFRNAY